MDRVGSASSGRLFREARPQALKIALGTGLMAVATVIELRIPKIGAALLDVYTETAKVNMASGSLAPSTADEEMLRLAGLFCVMALAKHAGEYLLRWAGERTMSSVRTRLFRGLMASEVGFFDEQPTGTLVSVLSSDVEAIRQTVTEHLPAIMRNACMCVVAAVHMTVTSPRLMALGGCVVPLMGIGISLVGNMVRKVSRQQQQQLGVSMGIANEGIASIRCVKAFGQEAAVSARYAAAVEASFGLAMHEVLLHKLWTTFNMLAGGACTILMLREAGRDVVRGQLTSGAALSFAVYGLTAGYAANDGLNALQRAKASAARATSALVLLDVEEARADAALAEERRRLACAAAESLPSGDACARVVVRDISFAYESAPSRTAAGRALAIDSVSFELAAERVTALVGPSGCGKSTMLSLLLRLYNASSGSITIGGVELSTLPNEWLRHTVGVVAQEPTIFRTTFHENIAFGARRRPRGRVAVGAAAADSDGRDAERLEVEVRRAAVAANAHDFIIEAGGYGASVGERGSTLSGGQRQRIAIARTVLRDPSVLLLDEATASLDAKSEQLVQQALGSLAVGRAMLVVAHRLATVVAAHEILVLERGCLVERGTHDALVTAGGLYSRLSALQMLDVAASGE